jgi:hypothetical protein
VSEHLALGEQVAEIKEFLPQIVAEQREMDTDATPRTVMYALLAE